MDFDIYNGFPFYLPLFLPSIFNSSFSFLYFLLKTLNSLSISSCLCRGSKFLSKAGVFIIKYSKEEGLIVTDCAEEQSILEGKALMGKWLGPCAHQ